MFIKSQYYRHILITIIIYSKSVVVTLVEISPATHWLANPNLWETETCCLLSPEKTNSLYTSYCFFSRSQTFNCPITINWKPGKRSPRSLAFVLFTAIGVDWGAWSQTPNSRRDLSDYRVDNIWVFIRIIGDPASNTQLQEGNQTCPLYNTSS